MRNHFKVSGPLRDGVSLDIPCEIHGSHKLWDMPKRWIERENIRTREAYCPDDGQNKDPLLCWTGASWIPVPGRGVKSAWCEEEDEEASLEDTQVASEEERRGTVTYALCPSCGTRIARRNRWKYWEPLYAKPQVPVEREGSVTTQKDR